MPKPISLNISMPEIALLREIIITTAQDAHSYAIANSSRVRDDRRWDSTVTKAHRLNDLRDEILYSIQAQGFGRMCMYSGLDHGMVKATITEILQGKHSDRLKEVFSRMEGDRNVKEEARAN